MIGQCFALAALITSFHSGSAFNLDGDLVRMSLRAAQLSSSLFSTDNGISGAREFVEEPDMALFVKEGNMCWVVFRGTKLNADDWAQNLVVTLKPSCSPSGECCSTHAGFSDAYFTPSFRTELENAVRDCKSTCPDCEVVVAGASQGAGIATIATIALQDLNPTTITFGQPATIRDTCDAINVDKYYRYVNTIVDGSGNFFYDPVPFVNWYKDKIGHMILLSDDKENVAYYDNKIGPDVKREDWKFAAHSKDNYVLRLAHLLGRGSFPIGADGWNMGFACDDDAECISPGTCVNATCSLDTGDEGGDQRHHFLRK